jgi:hypothetical protein
MDRSVDSCQHGPRLKQPTTNADTQRRGLDGFDAAFYFDTSNSHPHRIVNPPRLGN